jgi:hypothetical protein
MAYFLFLLAVFSIVAPFYASDMPGNAFGRFCCTVFAAVFWPTLITSCSVIGYILLG